MTPSPRRPATTALRLALPLLSALLTLSAQAARTKAVAPAAPAPSPAPAPQAPRLRVTLLAFGNPPAFWDVLIPVTQEAARQLDIDLEVLNAKGDHLAMVANAQAVSQRPSKPDYVIIDNQKGTGGRQLEPLAAAGIPRC
jgi:hypothetical protein